MGKYKISFKKSASKELLKIPKNDVQRLLNRIEPLSQNPRPTGSQKLSYMELYRIRQGDYRIVYTILDDSLEVHIIKITNHKYSNI